MSEVRILPGSPILRILIRGDNQRCRQSGPTRWFDQGSRASVAPNCTVCAERVDFASPNPENSLKNFQLLLGELMEPRRAAESVEEIARLKRDRHARGSRMRAVVAPLAMMAAAGILGTTLVMSNTADRAEPLQEATHSADASTHQLSRSSQRTGIPFVMPTAPSVTPSASATPSPSAPVSVTPSPSASATPSPSATATPSPTPKPSAAPASTKSAAPSSATVKAAAAVTKPAPTKKPKPSPTPELPALGSDTGALYTTASVNVRSGPGKNYDSLTALDTGSKVTATDVTMDGWQQVNRKGKAAWIKATYLTSEAPKPAKPKAKAKASSASGSSAASSSGSSASTDAKCSKAGDLESNLTKRTRGVLRAVCAEFPNVSSYGGYRPGDDGYHGSGQAIDVMISGDAGWDIAEWARSNAKDLGIVEVIYQQKIWTTQRSGEGWRGMSDRGSKSANHYDHVHLSVR